MATYSPGSTFSDTPSSTSGRLSAYLNETFDTSMEPSSEETCRWPERVSGAAFMMGSNISNKGLRRASWGMAVASVAMAPDTMPNA